MAHRRPESVQGPLFALALAALGILGGCATLQRTPAPGELEMELTQGATFAVVGRFHLAGVDPGTAVHDIPFDASTTRVFAELPSGNYILTLDPGASLVCPGNGPGSAPSAEHLVTTWPIQISIASGARTRAHINYGLPPTDPPTLDAPAPPDPCASDDGDALESGAEAALSRR